MAVRVSRPAGAEALVVGAVLDELCRDRGKPGDLARSRTQRCALGGGPRAAAATSQWRGRREYIRPNIPPLCVPLELRFGTFDTDISDRAAGQTRFPVLFG